MEKISKHMKGDHKSVAEDFKLSHEAKFVSPSIGKTQTRNAARSPDVHTMRVVFEQKL